jgi:hypothetical protein
MNSHIDQCLVEKPTSAQGATGERKRLSLQSFTQHAQSKKRKMDAAAKGSTYILYIIRLGDESEG